MKRKYNVKTNLKQISAIYKITCIKSDKVYIGETINVSQRIQKHFSLLRKNKHSNPILQNMFNKYGEETFIVDILEFPNTSDIIELKKLEKEYQTKEPNCISLDSNEIFWVERGEDWREKQSIQLNKIREKGLENWRIPIIVYDIKNKTHKLYKQLTDAEELIEQKHIYKNISKKILIPYRNQYVAFKEEDFTEENINKIITTNTKSYCNFRNLYNLYDLLENKTYYFSSKSQFSLFFSKSINYGLYDTYLNESILDFNFRCVYEIKTKKDLYNLNINLRKRLSKSRCNFKIWYDALLSSKTNKDIVNKTGINRTTIKDIFNDRSKVKWLILMDRIITGLPD